MLFEMRFAPFFWLGRAITLQSNTMRITRHVAIRVTKQCALRSCVTFSEKRQSSVMRVSDAPYIVTHNTL